MHCGNIAIPFLWHQNWVFFTDSCGQNWVFLRSSWDVFICYMVSKLFFPKENCRHFHHFWWRPKCLFSVSICECGNLNRHLKPNRDAFLTTTNCFLCLQPKQSISTSTKTNEKLQHKICQVWTNLWFQQKPTWLYILAIGLHSPLNHSSHPLPGCNQQTLLSPI